MSKKISIILCFLTAFVCYAQEYNYARYAIDMQYNKSSGKLSPQRQKIYTRLLDNTNKLQLEIIIDEGYSLTRLMDALSFDELDYSSGAFLTAVGLGNDMCGDLNNHIYYEKLFGSSVKNHYRKYENLLSKWEITGETKIVDNITLRKATTTYTRANGSIYSVIAWFDASKPQSIGPAHYNGLPGVITELYIESYDGVPLFTHRFNLIELSYKKKVDPIVVPPTDAKVMTFKESDNLYRGIIEKRDEILSNN